MNVVRVVLVEKVKEFEWMLQLVVVVVNEDRFHAFAFLSVVLNPFVHAYLDLKYT
jgi:hypothetical protein